MPDKDRKIARSLYLRVPRGYKERLLAMMAGVMDHLLKSGPFRDAIKGVLRKNSLQVQDLLGDVVGPMRSGGSVIAGPGMDGAYVSQVERDLFDKRAVEDIVLAGVPGDGPRAGPPECSIVIPVFNKDYLTYRCLRSLLLAKVKTSFEVIVVDNASTDHTREVLEHFGQRVRVLSNSENMGFVDACNQGAAAASGRYIVFLNNDTEVGDCWVDRLAETAEHSEDIGAVGAKLIFPNGVLQEAGGIIWSNGAGYNYGKGEDPRGHRYSYMRDVDYCSAACLLVKRELFEKLGGFDRRYVPAYYEDTDLCFGIRSLGYRVVYQPLCEVVHFEGATAGTDVTSGFKRFQAINSAKFVEKWREALSRQFPPSLGNVEAAADRRKGQSVLFIDYQVPKPDQDAGSVRLWAMLEILVERGCRVSFMHRLGTPFGSYARKLGGAGVRLVSEKDVWTDLAAGMYDEVVISRVAVAEVYLPKVKKAAPYIPVVFDTVDIHFIRESRMAELEGDKKKMKEAMRMKERELAVARACELTVAITEADKAHLLREDPSLNVEVIPMIHQPLDVAPSVEGRDALMFIGGFAHPPNVDAMLYFVKDILPLVRERIGEAQFLIVGNAPPDEVRALATENVTVTGFVPETGPYFAKSRVFVAPLRFGAGMKGKIGEAMTHGVPVVTTTIGAEGIGLVHGETAMITDGPQEFADRVAMLYKDDALWMKLSTQGRKYVSDNFSPEAAAESVTSILSVIKKKKER